MTEMGTGDADRGAARAARPSAASVIADLWSEREQSNAAPSVPPLPPTDGRYRPEHRPGRQRDGAGGNAKVVLAVVVVALLLGGGVGVFLDSRGFGQTSKAKFVSKADAVCGPANGAVTALAKPTSYPELATAAGTLVTSTDTQLAGLRKLSAPGGADGDKVGGLLVAMTQTNQAGRALQDAAGRGDDGATATAANQVRTSSKDATAKAQDLAFSACAIGMQPGVDTVVAGATGIVKTAFVAKSDTICRASARALQGIRQPRDQRDTARFFNQALPLLEKLVVDLKALPVPPGDEGAVADIMSGLEKANEKSREARDAAVAGDRSRFIAIDEETTVLVTAVDAKLDAYGLTTCGSNFGSR